MFKHIFFDFDGTLVDTGPGVKACVCETLSDLGYKVPEEIVLNQFLGPPLEESFSHFCGIEDAEIGEAVAHFRQKYNETGLWNSCLYPGVAEGLQTLKEAGSSLYITSSKPYVFVDKLLDRLNLSEYFSGIEANPMLGKYRSKETLISSVMERNKLPKVECCMVGDRKYDITAARTLRIRALAVAYGYGTQEELDMVQPDWVAPSFQQAVGWLLRED